MNDLNIDKLENEAMAKAYNTDKPDELNDYSEENTQKLDTSFFQISKLLNNISFREDKKCRQCFNYIQMLDCDWKCHYLLLLDYKIGMLIPERYNIVFESQVNNLIAGQIKLTKKREYLIEYQNVSKDEFDEHIKELEVVSKCDEKFNNNDQIFYEFDQKIYMFYENYLWTITGYTRNNIQEYFDMYLILMSIKTIENKEYIYNDNFKRLYQIEKNAIEYLYKGIDLRKKTIDEINTYGLTEDVVTFAIENNRYITVIDEEHQQYERSKKKDNEIIDKINVLYDNDWYFEGTFKTNILGTYNNGHILEFPEIVNSLELSKLEKINLLENVINQKQIELYEYKDLIANKLIRNLIDNLKKSLTKDEWNKIDLVNYLCLEKIEIENKTDELLYDYFKYALDNDDFELIKALIDLDYLNDSIIPNKIIIGPEFIVFACTILKQDKIYILFENNEFIEWK